MRSVILVAAYVTVASALGLGADADAGSPISAPEIPLVHTTRFDQSQRSLRQSSQQRLSRII
jgi:hypothetical protein